MFILCLQQFDLICFSISLPNTQDFGVITSTVEVSAIVDEDNVSDDDDGCDDDDDDDVSVGRLTHSVPFDCPVSMHKYASIMLVVREREEPFYNILVNRPGYCNLLLFLISSLHDATN